MTFDAIAEWLNKGRIPDRARKEVQRCARPFNLEEEISKGRVAEPRVSTSVVRLQYGGGR